MPSHAWESLTSSKPYEGDHGNRIMARFAAKVLPFCSENLHMAK